MSHSDLMNQCRRLQKTESRQASKNLFQELKLQPTEKDRFLHLIEEQPNEIAATHLPPSHSGIVTAAALKFLPEHRLQRLFESEFIQEKRYRVLTERALVTTSIMKNSGCLTMEPRDIAFGYSLMLGAGL